jgi:hypothetical protein
MFSSIRHGRTLSTVSLTLATSLMLAGCSINVKKNEDGEEKKVDIETPIGGIHVDKTADAGDTGLAVYPGARIDTDQDDHDDKNANVNLSAFGFGLRVAAVEYQSDDPPAKVVDFYRGQLKKFGNVLECHTSGHKQGSYEHHGGSNSKELTCGDDSGNNLELKVGNEDNQRIVSVESQGKGSKFALVHVQMRGKDTI